MRTRSIAILLLVSSILAPSLNAGPYDILLCPTVGGRFFLTAGQLWLEITKQHDKPVELRREQIANPIDDRSHEVLSKRGPVTVEVHETKEGTLFVHWGTLKDDKE